MKGREVGQPWLAGTLGRIRKVGFLTRIACCRQMNGIFREQVQWHSRWLIENIINIWAI